MEMTTDAENIDGKDTESDSALPTSVCDGSDSPSSRGSKKHNASESSVCSSLETPNDDSSKVPEVEFKEGHSESVADHPAAVTNIALDRDDVSQELKGGKENEAVVLDIPDQTDFKTDKENSEGAVVGRNNDAMEADDTLETSF